MALFIAGPAAAVDGELLRPTTSRSPYPTLEAASPGMAPPLTARLMTGVSTEPLVWGQRRVLVPWVGLSGVAVDAMPWRGVVLRGALVGVAAPDVGLLRLLDGQLALRWTFLDTDALQASVGASGRLPLGGDDGDFGGAAGGGVSSAVGARVLPWLRVDGEVIGEGAASHRSLMLLRLGAVVMASPVLSFPVELEARRLLDPRVDVGDPTPVELRGGLRVTTGPWEALLVAGTGLTRGVGAPALRLVASIGFQLETPPVRAPAAIVEPTPASLSSTTETLPPREDPMIRRLAAAAPPAPPMPSLPTPTPTPTAEIRPAPRDCAADQVEVHFETGRDLLDDDAVLTLRRFARQAHARGDDRVVVRGHADPRGGEIDNLALSVRRAHRVQEWLHERGLETRSIFALGEEQPVVEDHEVHLAASRRVQITPDCSMPVSSPTPDPTPTDATAASPRMVGILLAE